MRDGANGGNVLDTVLQHGRRNAADTKAKCDSERRERGRGALWGMEMAGDGQLQGLQPKATA